MEIKLKTEIARDFRKNPTETEEILWKTLKNRSFMKMKFKRQYVIDGFILDFYCPELNIAIEIDGPIHDSRKYQDDHRQELLERKGISFFRVLSDEVQNSLAHVLENLEQHVESIKNDRSYQRYSRLKK